MVGAAPRRFSSHGGPKSPRRGHTPLPALPWLNSRKPGRRISPDCCFRLVNHLVRSPLHTGAGGRLAITQPLHHLPRRKNTVGKNALAIQALLLLCYCCASSAIVITRIAVNMEIAALGAIEYIPPSPLEFPTSKGK